MCRTFHLSARRQGPGPVPDSRQHDPFDMFRMRPLGGTSIPPQTWPSGGLTCPVASFATKAIWPVSRPARSDDRVAIMSSRDPVLAPRIRGGTPGGVSGGPLSPNESATAPGLSHEVGRTGCSSPSPCARLVEAPRPPEATPLPRSAVAAGPQGAVRGVRRSVRADPVTSCAAAAPSCGTCQEIEGGALAPRGIGHDGQSLAIKLATRPPSAVNPWGSASSRSVDTARERRPPLRALVPQPHQP